MPAKKSTKAAKKPAKPPTRKATAKTAAPKKATRPAPMKSSARPAAKALSKAKKAVAKPAPAKPKAPEPKNRQKAAPGKPAATKVVVGARAPAGAPRIPPVEIRLPRTPLADDDADFDNQPSSLLAGPRNVKPYIPRRGEQYMSKDQLEHFAQILQNWKRDLMVEVDRTVLHMKDEAANFPDPNDRATQEEEFSLELRTRDRERKLIRKIDEALKRIEDGTYGYCLETGEEIGIKRLEARPVATLSVEAQERRERREKQYGDRDDRYR
jgi:RNA polymerase-binding transcription factor